MPYEGIIYRPPSEARSLILQVTVGCTHNRCSFCTMYKDKHFRMKTLAEVYADIDAAASLHDRHRLRIFLADGNVLAMPAGRLLSIMTHIRDKFPFMERITSYARADDINRKSIEELKALHGAGLSMIYLGAESGDDCILEEIHKGVCCADLIRAAEKIKTAGILSSVTFISGLGGKERLNEHAALSAALASSMNPDYVGFLTLMLDEDAPIMEEIKRGKLTLLEEEDVVEEMQIFLAHVNSPGTIFRANHASNYVVLRGRLNEDIAAMQKQLCYAKEQKRYRSESSRSL